MYFRPIHSDFHLPTLHQFVRDNPLGIFTTALPPPSSSRHSLLATHIPWVLDARDGGSGGDEPPTSLGVLRGHIARANPQARALIDAVRDEPAALSTDSSSSSTSKLLPSEVLVLFNSPVHHYITPHFYHETLESSAKVAPTWNYSAVEVYGTARIYHDARAHDTDAFLTAQLRDLAAQSERGVMGYDGAEGRKRPWTLDDAPEEYLSQLKKAILGVEITIEDIKGKFKLSQERPVGDREGVVVGLREVGTESAKEMALEVEERGRVLAEQEAKKKKERE